MSADQAGSVTKPARGGARPPRHVTDGRVLAHREVRRSGVGRAGRGRRSDRRPGPRRPTSGTCVRRASRWSRPWARPSRSTCSSRSDATRACTRARCTLRRRRHHVPCDQRGGDEQRRPPARPNRGSSRAPAGTPGHGGRVALRRRVWTRRPTGKPDPGTSTWISGVRGRTESRRREAAERPQWGAPTWAPLAARGGKATVGPHHDSSEAPSDVFDLPLGEQPSRSGHPSGPASVAGRHVSNGRSAGPHRFAQRSRVGPHASSGG